MKIRMSDPVFYRTVKVDGLSMFYREAGLKDGPTILLLHGLPSSSRMFEPLFTRLSDRYHLVAPDYPGFGHSDWPDPKQFAYTFDNLAKVINGFTEATGLSRYTLYMQDYGVPVGFRMALAHPNRIEALIVQDEVAHNEGLGANWAARRAFWADRPAHEAELRKTAVVDRAIRAPSNERNRETGPTPEIQVRHADLADHGRLHAAPRRHRIVLPPGSDRRLLRPCCSKQICNRLSSIRFHRTGHGKVVLGRAS